MNVQAFAAGAVLWALIAADPVLVIGVVFAALAVGGVVAAVYDALKGMERGL